MSDAPDLPDPAFAPIPCVRLDKDNAEWARKYLAKWKKRLETEGPDDPDFAGFALREVSAYEELLARFGKLEA